MSDEKNKPAEEDLADVVATGWGLLFTPLCARKTLTPEEAAAEFTRKDPPGTSLNQWVFTPELREMQIEDWYKAFPDDHPHEYPTQCPDYENRQHFLVNC